MLATLKTKIEERCEDLERMGRIAEADGLAWALKAIDDMLRSGAQTEYDGLVKQVRVLQKMPVNKAVLAIRLMTRQAYEDGIREGERTFADAMIVEADEETAERIRELCGQ